MTQATGDTDNKQHIDPATQVSTISQQAAQATSVTGNEIAQATQATSDTVNQ